MIGGKTLVITYQPIDFYSNDSHNLVLYLNDEEKRTESISLFLVGCLNRSLKPIYSWGDSISSKKIQSNVIYLPVNSKDEINYDFMETFISAQKKLAIKSVVEWRNKQIEATK